MNTLPIEIVEHIISYASWELSTILFRRNVLSNMLVMDDRLHIFGNYELTEPFVIRKYSTLYSSYPSKICGRLVFMKGSYTTGKEFLGVYDRVYFDELFISGDTVMMITKIDD